MATPTVEWSVRSPMRLIERVRAREWWQWPLLLLAAIYLAIVAIHFTTILTNTEMGADASSAQVIGELFSQRHGSTVYLGDVAWYSTLIFELATKWLPAHHEIWDAGPYGFALVSIALMTWTASQVAGARAGLLTAVLLLCASPAMLAQMTWLNDHITSAYSLALLGATLILLETRAERLGRWRLYLLVLASGLLVGVNMASDQLLMMAAPVSLALASVTSWRLYPSAVTAKAARWSAVMLVVMCGVAAATIATMHSLHVYQSPFPLKFASSSVISTNVRYWWQSLGVLANGNFYGTVLSLTSALSALCAGLVVLVLLLLPRFTWRYVQSRVEQTRSTEAAVSAYLIYWSASGALLSAAFILSSAPVGLETTRYLTAVIFAAAAAVPLYARHGSLSRIAAVAGTAVFALTSTKALVGSGLIHASHVGPTPLVAREVEQVAESQHLSQGYAVYWDAAPLTWFSNARVRAYPFFGCENGTMCPPAVNWITHWYELPFTGRTFVISDSLLPYRPPPKFGPAAGVYDFGAVTMYVYNYNVGKYMT